jgi:hypothetical protein
VNQIISRDPDDLYGDDVVAYLRLAVRRNCSMSIDGCINDETYALEMLDNGKDSIRRHNEKRRINAGQQIIIPGNDTGIIIGANDAPKGNLLPLSDAPADTIILLLMDWGGNIGKEWCTGRFSAGQWQCASLREGLSGGTPVCWLPLPKIVE